MFEEDVIAKPFLKWAGGKTQLLEQFEKYFPIELKDGRINSYYEPFLGSGAVFFYVIQKYSIKKAILSDINEELIVTYNVLKKDVGELIDKLKKLKQKYLRLNEIEREDFYYNLRGVFNKKRESFDFNNYSKEWIMRASQVIFLNKTCFNGLFRLNKSGEFNVPFGRYKNPQIFDEKNLYRVSELLKVAEIYRIDFEEIKKQLTHNYFIYFDPPYRPLSKTASFTSYSKYVFGEKEQLRLAKLFNEIGVNGNKLMLSNSDPKNENPEDDFFEKNYKGFSINRVKALRMINSKADKRGAINELIITNY